MKTLLSFYLPASLILLFFSCTSNQETHTAEARLRFTGLLAADGCGYFLDIDGKEYKPSNEEVIPASFQDQESSTIEVTYQILDEAVEYSCGMMPTQYQANLKILEINPK